MKKLNKLRSNPSRLTTPVERVTRSASWREDKASSTARGYGYEWQQRRRDYLRRNPLCAMCAKRGRLVAATHVDHIAPHQGDDAFFWDQTNWQGLCSHCHNSVKQRIERANIVGSKRVNARPRAAQTNARDASDLTDGGGGVKVQTTVDA